MQGDATMVAGSAGSGKTTLGLQYLVNGIIEFGENGIFVTFEELPDQLYRDANNFGWDLRKLEMEGRLKVICTSPNLLLETDGGKGLLDDSISKVNAKRIVVDSLNHIAMYVDDKELRKEAYRLMMYLKTKGLNSILLWESPQLVGQGLSITGMGLSFLVDCILLLKFVEVESQMKKALMVLKMRGSDHDKRLREYEITPSGVKIGAPFSNLEGVITGTPRRVGAEKFMEMFRQAARVK